MGMPMGLSWQTVSIHGGGEGKVTTQYTVALVEMARSAMERGELDDAEDMLKKALYYPENLGEGKLERCKDNHVNYYLGLIKERRGVIRQRQTCILEKPASARRNRLE